MQPNLKHPHVFIVVRVDDYSLADAAIEDRFSAVSVFLDREEADAEAKRLQTLRPQLDSRYTVVVSRLKGTRRPESQTPDEE
jgi:hypothetical protein